MPHPACSIRSATWQQDEQALRQIREQVFIEEQNVPTELEWDGEDETAFHLLAEDSEGNPIGTARMLPDGHIGRVAVLTRWRHCGIGSLLMQEMMRQAREKGHRKVFLDAQVAAIEFYRKLGFQTEGKTFLDAGILHRHMVLELYTQK